MMSETFETSKATNTDYTIEFGLEFNKSGYLFGDTEKKGGEKTLGKHKTVIVRGEIIMTNVNLKAKLQTCNRSERNKHTNKHYRNVVQG